uniref:PET domain-containing protein n=1 Tax=Taenia asiatica TaxID=60517 RepID=A0A0R3W017_TAEAS
LHFCDCEDQQCSVCEPMKNATERRFYPVEREAEQTNRTFTLTRKERGEVIYEMTMQIADSPDLTDMHNPRTEHAIRHAKCFEHYAYNKANVVEEYDNLIENYVLCRGRLLARHRSL